MSGEIPPEIGDLPTLEYLDLSDNDLTGVIPSELGQLDSLWNLDLEKNDLTGTVPAELGQLGNLTDLDLSENSGLRGPLPTELSALALEWLDLRGTDLCVPTEMEDWLNGIDTAHAELCNDGQEDGEEDGEMTVNRNRGQPPLGAGGPMAPRRGAQSPRYGTITGSAAGTTSSRTSPDRDWCTSPSTS